MRKMKAFLPWVTAILLFLVVAKEKKTTPKTEILMVPMPINIQDLKGALLWYTKHLHSFAHLASFDVSGFEESKGSVGRGLEDIEHHLKMLEPIDLSLWRRLTFAKRIFGAMVIAARELKLNYIFGSSYQQILALLLELNVTLFALYDSRGYLNSSISGYAKRMMCSRQNVILWADEFNKTSRVPSSARILFEYLNEQIKETIEDLESQISNNHKT